MKVAKTLLFLVIFLFSFLFLFPDFSVKFALFNFILLILFFFPFYFWVNSIKTMFASFGVLLVLAVALTFSLKSLPDKKYDLSKKETAIAVVPQINQVQFTWNKISYLYDFQLKKLSEFKKAPLVSHSTSHREISQTPVLGRYQQISDSFMNRVNVSGFNLQLLTVFFWILSIIFTSFVFSTSNSLLVSYSNILFMIPFAFFIGDYFFLKPFQLFLLYGQIMILGILTVFTIYRVKN